MSTIERLAKMAQETTPDQWVSIFSELHEQIVDLEQQLEAAERRNAELVEALEKLARLGNGDHYGNSQGNMIAREALAHSAQEKADAAE